MTGDHAADVADQAAKPAAQVAQLPPMTVELLGIGMAPRHHRRMPGDPDVGLPQPDPVPVGSRLRPLMA